MKVSKTENENTVWNKPWIKLAIGGSMGKAFVYALIAYALYDVLFFASLLVDGFWIQSFIQGCIQGIFLIVLYFAIGQAWGAYPGFLRGWVAPILFLSGFIFQLSGMTGSLYLMSLQMENTSMALVSMVMGAFDLIVAIPLLVFLFRVLYLKNQSDQSFQEIGIALLKEKIGKVIYGWIILLLALIAINTLLSGPLSFLTAFNPAILYSNLVTLGNPTAYFAVLLSAFSSAGQSSFELCLLAFLFALFQTWLWLVYFRWAFYPKESQQS